MIYTRLRKFGGLFLAVFLFSTPAHANAALPMVMAGWLAIFVALIPIILVETLVFLVKTTTSVWEAGLAMSVANIASTFVGIPLASWLHATIAGETPKNANSSQEKLGMVFWHVQYADETVEIPDWIGIWGGLVLMALFFSASWVTEQWVVEMMLSGYPHDVLRWAVLMANSVSYGLLLTFFGGSILYDYRANRAEWRGQVREVLDNLVWCASSEGLEARPFRASYS